MATPPDDDPKRDALARHGVLHPHPGRVSDPLFDDGFFDRRDLVQVKYEMIRRVCVDDRAVSEAAAGAGLSRPSFYAARRAFEREGLVGLLPAKKGPRRAHKLSNEVLDVVEGLLRDDPTLDMATLAALLRRRLDLTVHPRSIERALARRRGKKGGL